MKRIHNMVSLNCMTSKEQMFLTAVREEAGFNAWLLKPSRDFSIPVWPFFEMFWEVQSFQWELCWWYLASIAQQTSRLKPGCVFVWENTAILHTGLCMFLLNWEISWQDPCTASSIPFREQSQYSGWPVVIVLNKKAKCVCVGKLLQWKRSSRLYNKCKN